MKIESQDQIVPYLIETIKSHLANGEKVVWLIPGGSGIETAVAVVQHLSDVPVSNLFVTLTDERYGPYGHENENWQQLLDKGFSLPGAQVYRVLQPEASMSLAAASFERTLKDAIAAADYSIGLFGIGPDGHTSGIKPHTSSVQETGWVSAYQGPDYERITTTFTAIKQLDEAVIYAVGESKWPVVQYILHNSIDLEEQPAQILKKVPKLTLFTDYKEEK